MHLKVDKGLYHGKYLSYGIQTWKVDLRMRYILMVVLMTLALMQGHSGSAEEQIKLSIISTTKQQ